MQWVNIFDHDDDANTTGEVIPMSLQLANAVAKKKKKIDIRGDGKSPDPSRVREIVGLPVLDQILKLKTNLCLNKKLKNRAIKFCISQDFAKYRLTLTPVKIVHTQ